jgi:predicted component of type VI protein secretion system|tara:strand:+ start:130 stop:504 length:375 start_codon:yes stop_codon:yes gene_type:complete
MMRVVVTCMMLVVVLLIFSGCSTFKSEKQVEVITQEIEKPKLNLEVVEPLDLKPVKWIVITRENVAEVFTNLEQEGKSVALFALDTDTYEVLAINMEDIKRYILTQNKILVKYKEYYEPVESNQ